MDTVPGDIISLIYEIHYAQCIQRAWKRRLNRVYAATELLRHSPNTEAAVRFCERVLTGREGEEYELSELLYDVGDQLWMLRYRISICPVDLDWDTCFEEYDELAHRFDVPDLQELEHINLIND